MPKTAAVVKKGAARPAAPAVAKTAPKPVPAIGHSGDRTREIERLFQDGVLIDLNIGFWTARRRNTPEDLGVDRETLKDNIVGLGTKRLIPKDMQDDWLKVVGSARYIVRRNAFLFPVGDAWFTPLSCLPKVEQELLDKQAQFYKFRDALAENFDEIRRRMIREDPSLASQYPSKDQALASFYFTWQAYTVTLPKKVSKAIAQKDAVAERAAAQIERERAALAAQRRYEEALERRIAEFLDDAVKTLRIKTVDICRDVAEQIVKGDGVTNRTLTRLRGFVEQFKAMNFVGDEEVDQRIDALLSTMGTHDRDAFDNDQLRASLLGALNAVQHAASEITDVSDVTGAYRRRIVVD